MLGFCIKIENILILILGKCLKLVFFSIFVKLIESIEDEDVIFSYLNVNLFVNVFEC